MLRPNNQNAQQPQMQLTNIGLPLMPYRLRRPSTGESKSSIAVVYRQIAPTD